MKIAVLGAGAMGSLFGGYLSKFNEVSLIDVNKGIVEEINKNGIHIKEKDESIGEYRPKAFFDSSSLPVQDLIIVFVKSMYTLSALETNKALIGKNTYLMTLQNGAGHEAKLTQYADRKHVIIGSTQHNSSILGLGLINHGGIGLTSIGLLDGGSSILSEIAFNFTKCGLECKTEENVQKQIWHKLFTNTAASSLTALFQVPLGFIHTDQYAHSLMVELCKEAVNVANSLGLDFDSHAIIEEVDCVCKNAMNGYTSIYADIRDGRKSEVDTISGSVLEAAHTLGVAVPYHEVVVKCIHALENKNMENKK